jgi:GNAT superfamily N-acetyltransferase
MSGSTTRVAVDVTFLRQDRPAASPAPQLPADTTLVRATRPSVSFYRYLYHTVGAAYVWWLRRAMSDRDIAALLSSPDVTIHVLYRYGEPAGFFELEARYFGLFPHAVGQGMGPAFLRASADAAWARKPLMLTVNTCTADHPRALPNYLRAGFVPYRTMREIWDVPNRLGLDIPAHLKV